MSKTAEAAKKTIQDNLVSAIAALQVDYGILAARVAELDAQADAVELNLDIEENRLIGEWLSLQLRNGTMTVDTRVAACVREGVRFALDDLCI